MQHLQQVKQFVFNFLVKLQTHFLSYVDKNLFEKKNIKAK